MPKSTEIGGCFGGARSSYVVEAAAATMPAAAEAGVCSHQSTYLRVVLHLSHQNLQQNKQASRSRKLLKQHMCFTNNKLGLMVDGRMIGI